MIHPALAGLQAALDADPLDTTARLVLADLLEESGDEEGAACMRWMVRGEYAPRPGKCGASPRSLDLPYWCWTHDGNKDHLYWVYVPRTGRPRRLCNALPLAIKKLLPPGMPILNSPLWMYYITRQAAEDALLVAWRALPPGERPA